MRFAVEPVCGLKWNGCALWVEYATDVWKVYNGLSEQYIPDFVDHAVCYTIGQVHTNGIENFWSLLKRALKGTYISVEPFHLHRYIDEQVIRFNNRKMNDSERFTEVMESVTGKRLTYDELTSSFETFMNGVYYGFTIDGSLTSVVMKSSNVGFACMSFRT